MYKSTIVSAIESKVGTTEFKIWRIGLTHDLAERKKYWGETQKQSVAAWTDWQTDSLSDAEYIEHYFIEKGMKGGEGGNLSANKTVYVYVF